MVRALSKAVPTSTRLTWHGPCYTCAHMAAGDQKQRTFCWITNVVKLSDKECPLESRRDSIVVWKGLKVKRIELGIQGLTGYDPLTVRHPWINILIGAGPGAGVGSTVSPSRCSARGVRRHRLPPPRGVRRHRLPGMRRLRNPNRRTRGVRRHGPPGVLRLGSSIPRVTHKTGPSGACMV